MNATQTQEALLALQTMVKDPSTENVQEAARALVRLRSTFQHEGLPDWAGRSLDYRMTVERLYRDAGVPSDSEGPVLAKLRYHVGNAVRETAPQEDLEALGLKPKGPRARNREARRSAGTVTRLRRTPSIHDLPGDGLTDLAALSALIEHARADVRLLRQALLIADVPCETIAPALRDLVNETIEAISAAG